MGTAWTTITSLLSATYMSGQLTPDFCRVITSDQLTPDFCRVITEETYPCERNQIVHGRARDYGHEIVSSIRLLWLDALLDAAQRSGLPYPEQLDAGDEWSGLRAGGTRAEPAELKETDDDQWPILDLTEDFRELKKRADEPARQHRRTFKGAYASFGDDPSLEIAQTDGEGQLRFLTRWLSPQLSLPTSGPLNLVEWSWELGDARVQRFYRQQFPQDVDTSVVLPPERPLGILEQALYAYRLGHYALSNRLLWQVIEGLLRDVAFAIPQSTITGDDDTDDDGTVVFDPTVASRHDEKANLPKLLQGAEMQAWLSKIGFDTASFDVLYKDDRNPLLHGNNLEAQFPDSCHLKIAILRILYQGVCHTGLIYPSRLDPGDFWDPCQPYRRVGVATEQAYLDLVVTSDVSAYRGLMP
jgi:hypothetical protein